MNKEYKMTEDQLKVILDACKPTPVMFLSGGEPMFNSPFENAMYAWDLLANELGFIRDTVKPINGKNQLYFTADENNER